MSTDARFATVVIDGPGRNLLNPEVMGTFIADLQRAANDDNVAGIIITGDGDVFCGGLDVPAMKAGADPVPFYVNLVEIMKLLPKLPKPVVAAVNGDALAGGAGLVAAADYVVSTPEANIGTYEVSVGVWPIVSQVAVIKRFGARAAIQNVASGEPFTAERAREIGLVNEIVSADQLLPQAEAWLEKASRAGLTATTGRPSVYAVEELSYDDALDQALTQITAAYANNS